MTLHKFTFTKKIAYSLLVMLSLGAMKVNEGRAETVYVQQKDGTFKAVYYDSRNNQVRDTETNKVYPVGGDHIKTKDGYLYLHGIDAIHQQEEEREREKERRKQNNKEDSTQQQNQTTTQRKPLAIEMVSVKGGCYQMGDTFGDGYANEKPVHKVCVDDFSIGKYEVTQGQWRDVMGNNPSYFSSCGDDCPVENVSWNDIQEFIRKLGGNYRLPTEAEWEYAARSGGKKEKYSGGDNLDSVAWYNSNSENKTHSVGQKRANGLGIYDMSGNVFEWVQDWYDKNYYKGSSKGNPKGVSSGQYRVLRGGSWDYVAFGARAAARSYFSPGSRYLVSGFRLARTH